MGWDTHKDVMCQAASGHTGRYWDVLGCTGRDWEGMGHTEGHDVPGCIRTYWDILG